MQKPKLLAYYLEIKACRRGVGAMAKARVRNGRAWSRRLLSGVVVAEGEQGGEVVGVVAQTFSPCLDGFLREVAEHVSLGEGVEELG